MLSSRKSASFKYYEAEENGYNPNDGLYKGTIQADEFTPTESQKMPGKNNPYRYYELPEGYYDFPNRRKRIPAKEDRRLVPSPRRIDSRAFTGQPNSRQANDTKKLEPAYKSNYLVVPLKNNKDNSRNTGSVNRIHPSGNESIELQSYQTRWAPVAETQRLIVPSRYNVDKDSRQQQDTFQRQSATIEPVASQNRERNKINAATVPLKRPQDEKAHRKENKRVDPLSRSPVAISRTLLLDRSLELPQGLDNGAMYDPFYKLKADATYPSSLSGSVQDYVGSIPVKKVSSKEDITGNPLIPVLLPAMQKEDLDPDSYFPEQSYLSDYGNDDYEYDSLSRRFASIPSYKAVRTVLLDTDSYDC